MKPRIAVALSGGGFRASIFHLGVLLRVAELGWLPSVDAFSTVSGGSIVGAFAVQRWAEMLAAGGDATAFRRVIMEPFLVRLRESSFMLRWILGGWRWPARKLGDRSFTRTQAAAELFDSMFFDGGMCASLPERPVLILNATNLQSIRAWRFTRWGMGDSRVGHARWDSQSLTLGTAVGASAAFPPVFPPVRIRRSEYSFSKPLYGESALREYPLIPLSDGGVYDNSGLEALGKPIKVPGLDELIEPADLLIVSDGGLPTPYEFDASGIPAVADMTLLLRVDEIARQQVGTLRTRNLMSSFVAGTRSGILVGIASQVGKLPAPLYQDYVARIGSGFLPPAIIRAQIERIRTSLDRFAGVEVEALLYHAYSLTAAFTWGHRQALPTPYQDVTLDSIWKVSFDLDRCQEWSRELSLSAPTFRVR